MDSLEKLTLGLLLTLLGMGTTFTVLIFLAFFIKTLEFFFSGKKNNAAGVAEVKEQSYVETKAVVSDNNEIVAVISAAVMNMLGGRKDLVVRSIRRVPDSTSVWGRAGRSDQMANRL